MRLYSPCLVIFNPRSPRGSPGNFCTPTLPAFGYVSTTMAHNLYFIRSWYNWWQWGKVMPLGSFRPPPPPILFSPRQNLQTAALRSRCRLDQSSCRRVCPDAVLREEEMHSGPERSNYSACIYFEKHAASIIYSELRRILEWILEQGNNDCLESWFTVEWESALTFFL